MAFDLNMKSVVLLFFFLNGIIFSILLLKKGVELEKKSSLWMSLFVFTCSLYISPWMLGYANWYAIDGLRELLFFTPLQHYFLLGPVIFFYSKTLLNPEYKFRRKDCLHFIPELVYLLYAAVIFVTDVLILETFYFYADGRDKDLKPPYQIIGTLHLVFYVSISTKMYFSYRSKIYDEFSFAEAITFKWLKRFLIALLIILSARIVFLIIYPNWGNFGEMFWYYFIFSTLFFYIVLMAYTNTVTFTIPYKLTDADQPASEPIAKPFENLKEKKEELEKQMLEHSLYRNPTLSLKDISEKMDIPKEQLSTIINQGFKMNFNDYVNSHRIGEIEKRFQKGDSSNFTILGIAFDSGFNSKTTFNRAFKKHTGQTPIQYLKKVDQ